MPEMGETERLLGEREWEMWVLYRELGYLSLSCA